MSKRLVLGIVQAMALGFAMTALAIEPPIPGEPDPPPLSPSESMKAMQLPEGYVVEVLAAEPLVLDPVAFDWGPDGKLWVVEMADYPLGMDGHMKPGSRVVYLEDTDGDARYDKRTVFLDGVNFANGVLVWRKGVIITAAPEVFYAEDTDGDGRADRRETLITGFVEGNPQLRINGLRYGLDNWVYCANGLTNSPKVRSAKTGEEIAVGSRDIRFNPDTGAVEAQSGASQFGRNRDDWGNWFGVHNSFPIWHYVLEDHYLRRNPHVAAPDPKEQLRLPRNPPIYPRSKHVHFYDHPHRGSLVTSTCGHMIYRDELVWPRGEIHALSCEPHHNLIVHTRIKPNGVTFSGERVEDSSEWLASTDFWFKPVMLRTGPDGAIWLADYYRYFVEHPQYMPKDHRERLAPLYRAGDDRGRLYRIYRKSAEPRTIPRLDKLSPRELVKRLEHPSGEMRDLVQRMLVWNDDDAAVAALAKLAESSNALARLHALATLEGMKRLEPQLIQRALGDDHPGVRRLAVRLAESAAAKNPALMQAALKLVDDSDAKVRLQLACTLGEWGDPAAGQALARLALASADDPYLVAAVMSSAAPHIDAIVAGVSARGRDLPGALAQPLLSTALGTERRDAAADLLRPMLGDQAQLTAEQMNALVPALDAIARQKTTIQKLSAAADDPLGRELKKLAAALDSARDVAADAKQPPALRLAAVNLLGREPASRAADVAQLASLVSPRTDTAVQVAAVKALGRIGDVRGGEALLADWAGHGPAVRAAILDEMVGRAPWALKLLEQMEAGRITAHEMDASRRERLLAHGTAGVRDKAKAVLGAQVNADRQKVVAAYQEALSLKGDRQRGAAVFTRACAICHKLDDIGRDIGPNLRSITDRTRTGLLSAILDPNAGVEPRYTSYTCELNSGEVIFGIISGETGGSVTLIGLDGQPRAVLRSDIKRLASMNRSLMPEGLEAGITPQDMADLIEFVRPPE